MHTGDNHTPGGAEPAAGRARSGGATAWYAGPYKDALIYLMIALFLVELIVGGVSFFYGLTHAAPEVPGGPPMARFPWLGWAAAAVLAPVGLMLIVHLAGSLVSHMLGREHNASPAGAAGGATEDAEQVPERLRRFYAVIRNAPTVVLLLGILLMGAGLFFVDGAFSALMRLGGTLTPYIPWLAGSLAAVFILCYLVHRWFAFRHHRLQEEYAYRREVLERTGIVLVDRSCMPLPQAGEQPPALGGPAVEARALPSAAAGGEAAPEDAADADTTDAEIIEPQGAEGRPQADGDAPRGR